MLLLFASGVGIIAGFGSANRVRLKAIVKETISNSPDEDTPRRIGVLVSVVFHKDSDEKYSWDDLTEALLAIPFKQSSYGGTHLLYALIVIWRADGPDYLIPLRSLNCTLAAQL